MHFKKISMIGLGYIGLPTAAIMASRGLEVVGIDVNKEAVDTINQGKIHIVEPDLDIVVRSVVQIGQLRATTVPEAADAFLIAVPTPFQEEHQPDLSYIGAAAQAIAPVLTQGNLVVLESTSPVGTTEQLAGWLADARPDLSFPQQDAENADILIAHCPERVLPGHVLHELVSNDRIIGGMTPRCAEAAMQLYKTFVKGECLITDARTAELSKLTENAYRDVNIAFANELSLICEELHVNVWELIELANRHPRVNILQPGPGVGGHCIAVDPWFIVDSAPKQARLIRTAREVNDSKPEQVLEKVKAKAERFKKANITCFGLAFKANIDDLRESPALHIVQQLAHDEVGELLVVEPHITALPKSLTAYPHVSIYGINAALEQADIVLGLVDHDAFRRIDQDLLKEKIVIDCRGMWRG
ncbi:UDP-N-acetyl-D-mannosamine dehydrogenase [Candidatus Electrothrix gigas]